jgi:hypothetical protein
VDRERRGELEVSQESGEEEAKREMHRQEEAS